MQYHADLALATVHPRHSLPRCHTEYQMELIISGYNPVSGTLLSILFYIPPGVPGPILHRSGPPPRPQHLIPTIPRKPCAVHKEHHFWPNNAVFRSLSSFVARIAVNMLRNRAIRVLVGSLVVRVTEAVSTACRRSTPYTLPLLHLLPTPLSLCASTCHSIRPYVAIVGCRLFLGEYGRLSAKCLVTRCPISHFTGQADIFLST